MDIPRQVLDQDFNSSCLEQRIASGQSPQDLLEDLVNLSLAGKLHASQILNSLKILVKHGARVTNTDKGCPLEVLLEDAKLAPALLFSDALKEILAVPCEIPFHIFARTKPALLHAPLVSGLFAEHIEKQDECGRTISHYLWTDDSTLAHQAAQAGHAEHDVRCPHFMAWESTSRAAWSAQALLQFRGVPMDQPDHQGVTALDLCLERLQADEALMFPRDVVCSEFQAYWARKAPVTMRPSAPRLR